MRDVTLVILNSLRIVSHKEAFNAIHGVASCLCAGREL